MLIKILALCGTALALGVSPALAQPTTAPFLTAGRVIEAPTGFAEMCTSLADLCQSFGGVPATAEQISEGRASEALLLPALSPTAALAALPLGAGYDAAGDSQRISVTLPAFTQPAIDALAFGPALAMRKPAADLSAVSHLASASDRLTDAFWAHDARAFDARTHERAARLAMAIVAPGPVPAPANAVADRPALALGDERGAEHLLAEVNKHVNSRVRQQDDQITYGKAELWRPSGDDRRAKGDCEDIAIEKRKELLAAHFPADRLFFAVVYVRDIGLHTVLIARTAGGDVVLDSLTPYITPWKQAPYNWLAIEQPGAPMVWHTLA